MGNSSDDSTDIDDDPTLSESIVERAHQRDAEKYRNLRKPQRQGSLSKRLAGNTVGDETDSLDFEDNFSENNTLSHSVVEKGQQRVTEKYKNVRKLSRQGSLSKKIPRLSTTTSEADSLDIENNDVLSSSVMKRAHQRDAERYKHLLNRKQIPSTVQEPIPNEDDDGKEQPQLNTVVNKSVSKYSSGSSTGDDSVFHSTPQRPGRLTRDSTIGITPIIKNCPVSKRMTMVPEKSFEGLTKSRRETDGGSSSHVSRHVEGDDNDRRKILEILEGEDDDDDNRGKIPEIVEGDDDYDQGKIPESLPNQTKKKKLTPSEIFSLRYDSMYGTGTSSSRTFVGSNQHSSTSSQEAQAVLPNPCSERNTVGENSKSSQETSVVFSQLSTGDSSNRENSKSSSVQLSRLKSKTTLQSSPESSVVFSRLSTIDSSNRENSKSSSVQLPRPKSKTTVQSSPESSVVFSQLSTIDSNRENSKSSSVQLSRLKSKTTLQSSPEAPVVFSQLSTNDVSDRENLQPSHDPLALDDQQSSKNDSSSRKSPSTSSKESTPEQQSGSVHKSLEEGKDEQGDDDTILLNESTNLELAEISERFEQQYFASQNTLNSSNNNPGQQQQQKQQSTQNTPCNSSQLHNKIQTESYEGLPHTLTPSESMESLDNSDLNTNTNTHQQQSLLSSTFHLRTIEPKTYEEMLVAALARSNSIDACDIDRYDVLWTTECPMSGARRQLKTVCLLPTLCLSRVKIPERIQQKQNAVQHDEDSSHEMMNSPPPPPKKKRFTLGRNNSTVTPSRIYGSVLNYLSRTSSQSSSKQSSQRSIEHTTLNRDLVMSQNIVEEELSEKEEPDIPSQGIEEDLLEREGNVSRLPDTREILDNTGQRSQTKSQSSSEGENIDGEKAGDSHDELYWSMEDENENEKTDSLGSLKEPSMPSRSSTKTSKSSRGTNKSSVPNADSVKDKSYSENSISHSSNVNKSARQSSKSSTVVSQPTPTNISKRTLEKNSVVESSSSEKEVDPGREEEHKNKKTKKTKISDSPSSKKKKTVLKKKTRRRSPSISSPVGSSSSSEPSLISRVDVKSLGKSRRGKKTLAELQDNSNMVPKDYLIEAIRERGLKFTTSELDSFHDFLNKELESLCNALCQQAARPYGMFTYRQLEDAFKQKKLIDLSLGKNSLMLMFASILPHSVYQRAKGVLIPKEGQKDTLYHNNK